MTRPARLTALLFSFFAACAGAVDNNSLRVPSIAAPTVPTSNVINPHLKVFQAYMLDALPPQLRAETALAMAVGNQNGTARYVMMNAQDWRGRIEAGDKLNALTLSAMNSPRLDLRNAGFEVQLAMDGLAKTPATVEHLIQRLHEDPHGVGAWELWHLGVMGARGVERSRILAVLVATSHAEDTELRRWAVEALALFGGAEAIDPLLWIATNDGDPAIRENAFCALAQSGNFRPRERDRAIPGLLAIMDNPRADRRDVEWSRRALGQIAGFDDLPTEPVRLRERFRSAAPSVAR